MPIRIARSIRLSSLALLCLAGVSAAYAQTASRELSNTGGTRITMETAGAGTDPADKLQAEVTAWEAQLGPATANNHPRSSSGPGGTFAGLATPFTNDKGMMHLFVASGARNEVCHVRTPFNPALSAELKPLMQRCADELKHGHDVSSAEAATPSTTGSQASPSAVTRIPSGKSSLAGVDPPLHADNWSRVAGVYFQSATGFGAGGLVLINYEPVILFNDGTFYEIDDSALEDVDLAAAQSRWPKRWGRWTRSGDNFTMTNGRGHVDTRKLQEGTFFKAFPAEDGGMLNTKYQRVSGSGNTAMGGDVAVINKTTFAFTAGGQFSSGSSTGAFNNGNSTGVSVTAGARHAMPAPGTYALNRYTLTMRYPDGRVERQFFAYASHHNPAQLDHAMIFIGDDPFTTE